MGLVDGTMRLTWRGKAARLHSYFDQGKDLMERVKSILVVAAALKILGLPLWMLAGLAPCLIVIYIVVGRLWVRHGWYKQQTEVSSFERWTPVQVWTIWMQVRLLQKLGVEMNHFPTDRMPEEYLNVLASTRKEA